MQNAVLRNLSLVVCQGPLPVVSVHDADYSADSVFINFIILLRLMCLMLKMNMQKVISPQHSSGVKQIVLELKLVIS